MLIDIQLSHKSDECCVDGTIFYKNQLIPEYYTVNPFTITIIGVQGVGSASNQPGSASRKVKR